MLSRKYFVGIVCVVLAFAGCKPALVSPNQAPAPTYLLSNDFSDNSTFKDTTSYFYDASIRIVKLTNARQKIRRMFSYDSNDRIVEIDSYTNDTLKLHTPEGT